MSSSTGKAGNKYLVPATIVVVLLVVGVAAGLYLAKGSTSSSSTSSSGLSSSGVIDVVAAENFWGSLASQLGGAHVNVTSLVSDPNADPHEYTSNPANARAITNAQLIIVNGAGYDQWALSLIGSANSHDQRVLNVQELIGQPQNANPHFWYSPYYVNDTVHAVYNDLVAIDPTDTAYFHQRYASLNSSLWTSYMKQQVTIKQQFGGTPVASTEDVFVYMANATGLKVVSPPGFMSAVSEGSDPSAQDVARMEDLMKAGNSTVHLLAYNIQTPTPLTQNIKTLATQNGIPVVGVTETVQPPNLTFQAWMQGEVAALQNALNAQALGK